MALQQTLILIKHDGILRGLIGKIIQRFENLGLKMVGLKMVQADNLLAEKHYKLTDEWAKSLFERTTNSYQEQGKDFRFKDAMTYATHVQNMLKVYLKEGPIVAIVFEGHHSIEIGRKIVGHTEPRQASPGTIRGDFMHDSYAIADGKNRPIRNLIHASGTPKEAEREIPLWFTLEELHSYSKELDKHHN